MADSACSAPLAHSDTLPDDTRHTLDYTYSLDRWSCVRQMYFVHLVCVYLVFFSGLFCLASRLLASLHPWHALGGRLYILSMLWCMGSALVIHNVGLPEGVLVSFFILLVGVTGGWACVKVHQGQMQAVVGRRVDGMVVRWGEDVVRDTVERVKVSPPTPLAAMMTKARHEIISERGVAARIFSYKAAHGALMFMSWVNIAGRIISSNQSGDFACYTYPVYKQLDSPHFKGLDQTLTYVPVRDVNYSRLPWSKSIVAWGVELSVVPLVGALAIGWVFVYVMPPVTRWVMVYVVPPVMRWMEAYREVYHSKTEDALPPVIVPKQTKAMAMMPKIDHRFIIQE